MSILDFFNEWETMKACGERPSMSQNPKPTMMILISAKAKLLFP